MTIYMSCFGCSKGMKMVEDPLEKAFEKAESILQDLSGIVLEVEGKVLEKIEDTAATVIQDLSGIVHQVEEEAKAVVRERAATVSAVVEKGSSEIEDLKE